MPEKSKTREAMRKDTSCINILTCENYIKKVLREVSYEKLFEGTVGSEEFLYADLKTDKIIPVDQTYLLEQNHWVSIKLI